jgi:hypothetical protein
MSIDEQELRRRLEDTATRVSTPRFTTEELGRRIRRRRGRIVTAVSGAVLAAAAIAVAVPVVLSGTSSPPIGHPARVPPSPVYIVTVNGQTAAARPPRYVIAPGKNLTIAVEVIVPARITVTGLWLGITNGILSPSATGPADMSPVLGTYTHMRLLPGVHRFNLRWVVPAGLRVGASRQLSVEWLSSGEPWPPTAQEEIIAELDVQTTSGS